MWLWGFFHFFHTQLSSNCTNVTQQLLVAAAHFEIDAPGNGKVKLKRVTAVSESESDSARAVQDWALVVTVAAHMSKLRGGKKHLKSNNINMVHFRVEKPRKMSVTEERHARQHTAHIPGAYECDRSAGEISVLTSCVVSI